MGNSNSIPNLATSKQRFTLEELHSYYQQEGLNFNSDNRRSLRNKNENHNNNQQTQSRLTDAYLHETFPEHQLQQQQQSTSSSSSPPIAHVKVLPDFNPDGARLRCTTNGNILNSGGTISGRKEQQQQHQQQLDLPSSSEPFITSKSSSALQNNRNRSVVVPSTSGKLLRNKSVEPLLHSKELNKQRNYSLSTTKIEPINSRNNQHNLINKNLQNDNFLGQRNINDNEINHNLNNKLNLFSSSGKTNIVKCKKKKSAPLPPSQIRNINDNIITNNNRNNHINHNSYDKNIQKQQQQPSNHNIQLGQQKKLRLFKTNAETKKSLPITSTSSSIPQYQNNNSRGNNDNNIITSLTGLNGNNDKKNLKTSNNYKDSRVKLFPTPIIFRREKSFDASLLLNHRKQYNDNNNNNNNDKIDFKHNYNQNFKLQKDIIDSNKTKNLRQTDYNQNERSPNIKKSHLVTKINNKIPQSGQLFKNNFKKELEEATKNRRNSISAIDLTLINNSLNYDNNNKELKLSDNDLCNNKNISNRNDDLLKNDNQNSQLTSRKFYFGMSDTKKYNEIKCELKTDLNNDKLLNGNNNNSLSDKDIDNHILSEQLIDQKQIDLINDFGKNYTNHHKDLNSLSTESDDILSEDILNNEQSLQLYKIPINCLNNNNIDDDSGDIQLNVRPTLPRRQLEIPRFSPAAAWRMLNDEQKNLLINNRKLNILNSSTETLSIQSLDLTKQQNHQQQQPSPVIEERIQRIFREPPLIYSDNKSGDSGISGDDAGLQLDGGTDSPGINFITDSQDNNKNNQIDILNGNISSGGKNCIGNFLIPWTPQQDLEDDDDDDDDDDDEDDISSSDGNNMNKLLNDNAEVIRGHVFSVSLPRDGHNQAATSFGDKEKIGFSSLQKLKRTVSGAFLSGSNCTSSNTTTEIINSNNFNSLQNDVQQTSTRLSNYCSDNWLLSRSALNSIENSQISSSNKETSLQQQSKLKSLNHQDINSTSVNKGNELLNEDNQIFKGPSTITSKIQSSSLNYVTTGRHMMYLPNRIKDNNNNNCHNVNQSGINNENNNKNNKKQFSNLPNKSNNKIENNNSKKEILRENLQDTKPVFKDKKSAAVNRSKNSSNHRFTFQSTVRQIERRRIADRLSKEAEEKEALRKSELEAMTRVEEEFQRKRAREKATICHQLRLYSMEENQCNSLPIDLPVYNDESTDLSLQKLPIIIRNSKLNKFSNNNNNINNSRNYRAEPDGAVSNSPPPSPTYSQNNQQINNINGNYYDEEYFNISDDSKGLQNSNQRQRKNSINLNYFQKTGYMDELNQSNRSPIQRYNSKLLNSEKIDERHNYNINNIGYDATTIQDEFNSDSDISDRNDTRLKYRKYSHHK